jgi:hypothetical protein
MILTREITVKLKERGGKGTNEKKLGQPVNRVTQLPRVKIMSRVIERRLALSVSF